MRKRFLSINLLLALPVTPGRDPAGHRKTATEISGSIPTSYGIDRIEVVLSTSVRGQMQKACWRFSLLEDPIRKQKRDNSSIKK